MLSPNLFTRLFLPEPLRPCFLQMVKVSANRSSDTATASPHVSIPKNIPNGLQLQRAGEKRRRDAAGTHAGKSISRPPPPPRRCPPLSDGSDNLIGKAGLVVPSSTSTGEVGSFGKAFSATDARQCLASPTQSPQVAGRLAVNGENSKMLAGYKLPGDPKAAVLDDGRAKADPSGKEKEPATYTEKPLVKLLTRVKNNERVRAVVEVDHIRSHRK